MPGGVSSQMQKLDFTEKLIEKGKRESADALLKKLKVGRRGLMGFWCFLHMYADR